MSMDGEWISVAVALLCGVSFFLLKWSGQKQNLKRKLQIAREKREAGLKQAEQAVRCFKAEVTHYILLLKRATHNHLTTARFPSQREYFLMYFFLMIFFLLTSIFYFSLAILLLLLLRKIYCLSVYFYFPV